MKPDRNRPVTIEDLLRLKRAERPPTEFWTQFDRELRAKQLAALVAKRPWWQTLPGPSFRVFARFSLPLGAAAVLGVAFLSVRDQPASSNGAPSTPVANAPVAAIAPSSALAGLSANDAAQDLAVAGPARPATESSAPVGSAASSALLPAVESPTAPILAAVSTGTGTIEAQSPAAGQLFSVNLASSAINTSAGPRFLGAKTGFESRALPARATVEPLQQMTSPGETRRARLLTAMVSAASLETSPRTTERVASRIAEEHLYDQVQRFGARGDRLHVKF